MYKEDKYIYQKEKVLLTYCWKFVLGFDSNLFKATMESY
jgi:hypothetical protein